MPQIVEVNGSRIEFPDGMAPSEIEAAIKKNFLSIPAAKKETTLAQDVAQFGKNALGGAIRGAGSIGATLARPFETASENEERRKRIDENMRDLIGADPESLTYQGLKIGAEVGGTAGLGGALAKGLTFAPRLASAVASGGFSAPGANMATRVAGGAITGGASAGLVNPDDATTGAIIGGILPPALKGAGIVGGKARDAINNAFLSDDAAAARKIAEIAGAKTKPEIEAIKAALSTPRPSNIGVNLTTPQILQNEGVSQLQRSLQNIGDSSVNVRLGENQKALMDTLNRIAPVGSSVQDVAQDAGNAIQKFAKQGEAKASEKVSALFDAVDPFNEARFLLPVDQMTQQQGKYLGRGTFGMGSKASEAVDTARGIGTEFIEGIAPIKAAREETLLQAVKKAGGINPKSLSSMQLAGEIRDLKQSGLGRLTNATRGKSVEKLAEDMWQRGFIPDDDPATLIQALQNGGDDVAMGGGENAFRLAMERSMGDAPEAMTVAKPVTYKEVQNLRSSIASAIDDLSSRAGRKNEISALRAMKDEIDSAVNRVASGKGAPEEYFSPDMVDTWRQGIKAHADKKWQFNTGPQSRLFARGGDGMPAAQGAEVPRLFFNSLRSQTDDIGAFNRLTGGDSGMADALKRYATTSAAQNTDALGNLTNNKFGNWYQGHSGAIGGLFGESDKAALGEMAKYLKTADAADRLGMAKGSNTMQNINAALSSGLFENPLTRYIVNALPVGRDAAKAGLEGMSQAVKKSKAEKLGGLLADPETLNNAIEELLALRSGSLLGLSPAASGLLGQSAVRIAPVLAAQ